jgi:hypothetical protein
MNAPQQAAKEGDLTSVAMHATLELQVDLK